MPAAINLCSEKMDESIFYDDTLDMLFELNPSVMCLDGSILNFKGNTASSLVNGYEAVMVVAIPCD